MTTIQDRLSLLARASMSIKYGSHPKPTSNGAIVPDDACVMELVAWVAGDEWSDSPPCTSTVIAAFLRSWNDRIKGDAVRTRLLRPLIPAVLGTAGSCALERRRAFMAVDWSLRTRLPLLFEALGHPNDAAKLRALSEIVDDTSARAARTSTSELRSFHYQRWQKVRAALRASDAVAGAAASDDAYAASAAASAASADKRILEAARAGGYEAARKVADETIGARLREKLGPLIGQTNASAQDLVRRMAAMKEAT